MSETFSIGAGSKSEQYQNLNIQLKTLLEDEPDLIANMANLCAALKTQFNWLWIGFYLVKDKQLVLGPFQGPVACTRIPYNKGVCGTAWAENKTIIVPDVNLFLGHIAWSSLCKSEIVVPFFTHEKIVAVLDIDSRDYGSFDETDRRYLEQICQLLEKID